MKSSPALPAATSPHAPSADELTARNVRAVMHLEETARRNRSRGEIVADRIAQYCGSMRFFWTHVAGFTAWILINSLPGFPHFDPYPFTFLTFVVSLEAIFLSTFILISQNHETKISERRNLLDLQINLLAEQENTKMLTMLEAIAKAVGARLPVQPEDGALEEQTDPNRVAQQIDQAMEGK